MKAKAILLMLSLVVADQALAAPVATIPVKPLPRPAAKPAPAPLTTQRFWLSGMVGVAGADEATLGVSGFGIYGAGDDVVVGLRARFAEGFASVRHGRETALMVGGLIGSRKLAWWGLGISRFELERRGDRPDNTYERQVIGLPLEVVFAPHGKLFGVELRAEANINKAYPQITLGVGLSLGGP